MDQNSNGFFVRLCLVTGAGFLTAAYDLFAINLVSLMLGYVYYKEQKELPVNTDLCLKISGQVGAIVGQILFGYLADHYGRRKMYGVELMLTIGATISSTLVGNSPKVSIIGSLIFYRLILGIGAGGNYPLSAVITAEFLPARKRGRWMAGVFAQQGLGILLAAVVSIVMLGAYRSSIEANEDNLDSVWRLVLGFGAIPALFALFFRLTIPETPVYEIDVSGNSGQAALDIDQIEDTNTRETVLTEFRSFFSQNREYLKYLIGTCVTWFCIDISFYGIGLNNAAIFNEIGFDVSKTNDSAYTRLLNASIGNVIITLMGTIPGYLMTIALIDYRRVGRIRIMYIGFAASTILLLTFGLTYKNIVNNRAAFIVMFILIQDPNNANEFLGPLITTSAIFMVIGLTVTYFCFSNKDAQRKLSGPLTDENDGSEQTDSE
ncbi:5598_t:CDS:2 [Paraglomus occultum]|uniref:5598_t:CDS:1 n=1 Tax=Paraglomus occultum TaxID=144539 RepID=A0A9N9ACR5_9GLOM|nr:5598_t:CDS:2 [Paraglomus occultum]